MSEVGELPSWSGEAVPSKRPITDQAAPAQAAAPPEPPSGGPVGHGGPDRKRRSGLVTGLLLGLLGGLLLAAVAVGAFWLGSRQNDDTSVASTAVGGNDEAEDAATTAGDPATPTTADGVATSTDDDVGGDAVGDAGADAGSATDDGGSVAAGDSVDGTNPVGAADGQLLLPDGFVPSDPNYEQRIQNAPQYAVVRGGIVYLYGFARSQELLDEAIAVTAGVMGPEGYVVERIVDPDAPEVDGAPIYVDDKVLFAFNSTELDPASLPILDLGVALMLQNPTAEMVIIARSDAVGSADTNLEISERRGQAVVEYWASKGVETERMTVDARGEADASEDDDERTAALNRSVEFVVSGIADG